MNAASATPSMVFATVLNLSTHHIEKLNPGGQVFYEKLKQEIISKLDAKDFLHILTCKIKDGSLWDIIINVKTFL